MKPTDYIKGGRRGREAHDLELEAMRDPFLSDALEGMEAVEGDHADAAAQLERRIAARTAVESTSETASARRRRNTWRAFAAAAAVLVAATAGFLTLRHTPVPPGGEPPLADNRQGIPAADSLRNDSLTGHSAAGQVLAAGTKPGKDAGSAGSPGNGKGSGTETGTTTGTGSSRGGQAADGARQPGGQQPGKGEPAGKQPAKQPDKKHPGEQAGSEGSPGTQQSGNGQSTAHRSPAGQPDENPEQPGLSEVTDIDKVVVVGYGTAKKNTYTGSAGNSNCEASGTAPTIRVRGTGSTDPKTPSYGYLVDGKPYDDIGWLDADRVASISIDHPRKRIVIQTQGTEVLAQAAQRPNDENMPFYVAETMPRFQGGDLNGFRRWVQARIRKLPLTHHNGLTGRVVVSFTIDTLGWLRDIKVLQSPDKALSREVIRVLNQSPRWEPGRQMDKKVRIKYTLPVDFEQAGTMPAPEKPALKPDRTKLSPEKPAGTNGEDIFFEEFEDAATPLPVVIEDTTENSPSIEVDVNPQFEGGDLADFRRWVQAHIRKYEWGPTEMPEFHSRVIVSFVIDTTGRLGDIRILKSPCREFTEEAVRVLELSPRWEPGYRLRQGGAMRNPVKFTIPVDFGP